MADRERKKTTEELGLLSVGDKFTFEGSTYTVREIGDEEATVVLMKSAKIRVTQRKTETQEYGIAILQMPITTEVTKV